MCLHLMGFLKFTYINYCVTFRILPWNLTTPLHRMYIATKKSISNYEISNKSLWSGPSYSRTQSYHNKKTYTKTPHIKKIEQKKNIHSNFESFWSWSEADDTPTEWSSLAMYQLPVYLDPCNVTSAPL